jgi:hypothetical protein
MRKDVPRKRFKKDFQKIPKALKSIIQNIKMSIFRNGHGCKLGFLECQGKLEEMLMR